MKAKRYTEEQIIAVLKESEAGAKTKDLCRRHGISEQNRDAVGEAGFCQIGAGGNDLGRA